MRISPLRVKNETESRKLISSLGVSPEGVRILSPKTIQTAFKIEGIKSWEANIIKQHLLSLGSDAAIERRALVKDIKTSVLIFGNLSQLRKLSEKLKTQPFSLREISENITAFLDNLNKESFIFRARNKVLKISKPIICGIINTTTDSFSGDGLLRKGFTKAKILTSIASLALGKAEAMIKAGAKIIDIGGESTRPFSKPLRPQDEIRRVIPILRVLRKEFKKTPLSVDTYKYSVAKAAVAEGADIINDITALRSSPRIATLIKKYKLGCILMHMQGRPRTMQINPGYKDVTAEIMDFFKERLEFCSSKGIKKTQILIDPGIGFGKRPEDNNKIISELYKFKVLGRPIFLGLSRKSFIGKILKAEVGERLIGTIAASTVSLVNGANILRVHDVRETAQAIKVVSKITNN
ncbi:MAG: dihydropteroate synthase [Candidatus Omnitrophota bacterium]